MEPRLAPRDTFDASSRLEIIVSNLGPTEAIDATITITIGEFVEKFNGTLGGDRVLLQPATPPLRDIYPTANLADILSGAKQLLVDFKTSYLDTWKTRHEGHYVFALDTNKKTFYLVSEMEVPARPRASRLDRTNK
jgi:hypothetical protein